MNTPPMVGFTLQPSERYMDPLGGLLRTGPDYYEVAPETTWRRISDGSLVPNGYSQAFEALAQETGKPLVAHGVGFSVGSANPDPERRQRWLDAMAVDHARRPFLWYTDHLGASVLNGAELTLPLALPHTDDAAEAVAASLRAMAAIVPDVGFENSVFYFHVDDPQAESAFYRRCLKTDNAHWLLDLHNLHTTAVNTGIDPQAWLDAAPLERVIEIHISGGSWSEPGWLPSKRSLRLDSHEGAVPEEVWSLLEGVLPRCPNLRGVTLERMEGTVEPADVPLLEAELGRVRQTVERCHAR